jgi:hypothetical protein
MWLVLVESVYLVPMLTVDESCHSLLLVGLFIDAFTSFPWVLFGLAAPVWALGLGFSAPHMHRCYYKVNYHIHIVPYHGGGRRK